MKMVLRTQERRATAARLSLCLGFVAVALLALGSEARAAAPISPKVLGTNPTSSAIAPAASTAPLVYGEAEPEDGIVIQKQRGGLIGNSALFTSGVEQPTQHPEYEIFIYANGACGDAPIAHGHADAFEEAGIAVSVPANAVTTLSANQLDPANPAKFSACSGPISYWEGNVPSKGEGSGGGEGGTGGGSGGGTAPPATGGSGSGSSGSVGPAVTTGKPDAPRLHLSPKAVANFNTPAVAGTAPGAGSVSIYANGDCSGAPIAKGSAAQLTSGFGMQVADNTSTTYSAVSIGGKRSDCSSPVTYVEDSTAPVVRVTMGPGVKTRKHKVALRFADLTEMSPGTSIFTCKVDNARWKPCASPLRLKHLRLSKYVVRIRAVDLAGNAEKLGAKRIFRVVPGS
jgi:hypothetical protein